MTTGPGTEPAAAADATTADQGVTIADLRAARIAFPREGRTGPEYRAALADLVDGALRRLWTEATAALGIASGAPEDVGGAGAGTRVPPLTWTSSWSTTGGP
jgi:hypothetical protein